MKADAPVDMPDDLMAGGQMLWRQLLAQDVGLTDDMNPARNVALEACRTKDRCDILALICLGVDVMADNGKGQSVTHPAWVESRQQANTLKLLIGALRLPDEATGARPQRHAGASNGRRPNGIGSVSSLDRARAARAN